MNIKEEKAKVEAQFNQVKAQVEQAQGVVNSGNVKLQQLTGRFELLTEMEQNEEKQKPENQSEAGLDSKSKRNNTE